MAKKFSDLRAQMKPEALQRADAVAKTLLAEMRGPTGGRLHCP